MLASEDQKIIEKMGWAYWTCEAKWKLVKKTFVESWSTKHYIEQGGALHVVIKSNEPLLTNAYKSHYVKLYLGSTISKWQKQLKNQKFNKKVER
jgi:hypothetical protein